MKTITHSEAQAKIVSACFRYTEHLWFCSACSAKDPWNFAVLLWPSLKGAVLLEAFRKGGCMHSGIYTAEFLSNQSSMGRGIVVLTDNALYGGDAAFYYKGKYSREGENRISANVEVVDYSGKKQSVLGPLGMFRLALTGVGKDQQLTLVGQVEGQPNLRISIILKKVDELVEA